MLSEKESFDQGNPIKASSELNYYPKNDNNNRDFERRRQFLGPRFSNPTLRNNNQLNRLSHPNRNLIPELMRLPPIQGVQDFNVGPLNDLYRYKKSNARGRQLELIKSPKSEMNNYLLREAKSHGKGVAGRDFSAMVSVKDYKDNISNQDALSRRNNKGENANPNPFYQNSSNNLPSNNISEQNYKSSILSFKDNQNDVANLSANAKPDDPMVVLQSLRLKNNSHPFGRNQAMGFNSHFPFKNEPSFHPIQEPKVLPEINKLVNLQQMSFEKTKKRNLASPQLRRPIFQPIYPKKVVRPSITSNADELINPANDQTSIKSPPFLHSVDRETQILPPYNYSAKCSNFHSTFKQTALKNEINIKKRKYGHWEIQGVGFPLSNREDGHGRAGRPAQPLDPQGPEGPEPAVPLQLPAQLRRRRQRGLQHQVRDPLF